jgi:tetratricopeptide (TPR) repeat protein
VQRSEATVEEVLRLLPGLEELEFLRLRLIGSAVPDPNRAWDSSSDYATVDKRILRPADVEGAVTQAEEALRDYVALLHDGLRPFFHAFFAGDADAAARHLVAMGERQEEVGRARNAREFYRAALRLSLPLADKGAQVLALRRIGRVSLALGDFPEAASHYERSDELALDSGDLHGQVVARTGAANVLTWQGRWLEAERRYLAALRLAGEGDSETLQLERGQIFNNLANVATRLERVDEAEGWFARASATWQAVSSPQDLAVCLHNEAHLRVLQGRSAEARVVYERALALPVSAAMRASVATDLAELSRQEGHLTLAEDWARVAEEHAIAAGSPYALGRMYHGRGNIARARGDADGFTFFEKALEIARDKGYRSLEAETLADYAELRIQTGGAEEALAYLEHAREVFHDVGAVHDRARVEAAIRRLTASGAVAEE